MRPRMPKSKSIQRLFYRHPQHHPEMVGADLGLLLVLELFFNTLHNANQNQVHPLTKQPQTFCFLICCVPIFTQAVIHIATSKVYSSI